MLAQQPQPSAILEKYWSPDVTRTLEPGTRYLFLVVVPKDWTQEQADALLVKQGWDITSFNAPPDWVKATIAQFEAQGVPSPQSWMVIAVWKGATSTLPGNINTLYFGPIFSEYQPSGPVAPPSTEETSSIAPLAIAFGIGALFFGGMWWYLRSAHVAKNPIRYDSSFEYKGVTIHVHQHVIDGDSHYCANYRAIERWIPHTGGEACSPSRDDAIQMAKRRIETALAQRVGGM